MIKRKEIYLDHAATTPIDRTVLKKMEPYLKEKYGNPSSIHQFGEIARQAVNKSRQQIADFFGCLPEEIYFTSGATESDNWAIRGIVEKVISQEKIKPHLITSSIEHKAVLSLCQYLFKKKLIDLTLLNVNQDGLIEIEDLKKAIKKDTRLVSIMFANSEIGTVQPIRQIGEFLKKENQKRKNKILFYTDAVQAINYLNSKVDYLGVDLLSFSSHKIYGPKGIGGIYIKQGTPIKPLLIGGGHEKGMRSGTENVPGIVGFGEAIKKINYSQNDKIKKLRNQLITGIMKEIPDVSLNGSLRERLPSNAHLTFKGVEGEGIVFDLSQRGVMTSTSSACASHSLSPSHVLMAIGLPVELAHSSVRFTLGKETSSSDINYVLKILPGIIKRLRKISGYKHV